MVGTWVFVIVACRGLIELLFWLLIGRSVLALLAGRTSSNNTVLWLFDVVLRPPRMLVARLFPEATQPVRDLVLGVLLMLLWLGLALVKQGLPS